MGRNVDFGVDFITSECRRTNRCAQARDRVHFIRWRSLRGLGERSRSSTNREHLIMSMCHKAYALDHEAFSAELAPILYRALETGLNDELSALIDDNLRMLTFPWDDTPLPADWRSALELGDTHELGDFALTKYYDAAEDCGLQEHWFAVENRLSGPVRASLLGNVFGPSENVFDPGRMGSYFQTAALAGESLERLRDNTEPGTEPFLELLYQVVKSNRGVYVTF